MVEANIDSDMSKYLYTNDVDKKMTQDSLYYSVKRYIQFSSKREGFIDYVNIGVSSATMKFENSYKEARDSTWKKEMNFLKITEMDYTQ